MSEFDPITGQLVITEGSTEVPTGQFERNEEIKSIALPDTLLKIHDQGFAYTSNLEDINFGESLVSLGKESFFATFSLKNLTIPDSVEVIGDYAFQYGRSLSSVDIGDSVTSIGKRAFSNARILNNLVLGESLREIGDKAFYDCPELEVVNFPSSMRVIGASAFEHCLKLAQISIPVSIVSLGENAFANTAITDVHLPDQFRQNPPVHAFDEDVEFIYQKSTEPLSLQLTESGWSGSDQSGLWTQQGDVIDPSKGDPSGAWVIAKNTTAKTLRGNDQLTLSNSDGTALMVEGSLNMGQGDDQITVIATVQHTALHNNGVIKLGKGADSINVLAGGLDGTGKIKLGNGKDEFVGFGNQSVIHGGKGSDTLKLDPGTYGFEKKKASYRMTDLSSSMTIKGFESIAPSAIESKPISAIDINSLGESGVILVTESGVQLNTDLQLVVS